MSRVEVKVHFGRKGSLFDSAYLLVENVAGRNQAADVVAMPVAGLIIGVNTDKSG